MIYAIIVVLAVIQSVFGIGLLVFGTPTLLLLGYSYQQALATLLPASLAVSALQLVSVPPVNKEFAGRFALFCLPTLAVTLGLVSLLDLKASLNFVVAVALAAFVLVRSSPVLETRVTLLLRRHQGPWLVLMGLVHGLSNLGGGLLTIFANALETEKEKVRSVIVYCYVSFAVVQLLVLGLTVPGFFTLRQLIFAAISGAIYLFVGRHVFSWVSAPTFRRLFTGFMASYACLLGLRVAGLL